MNAMTKGDDLPTPFLLAMLVCDSVINDATTGKASIIGVFDTVWSPTFPVQQPVSLYIRMTDAAGSYKVKLQFVRLDDDAVVATVEGEFTAEDRLRFVELSLRLPPVELRDEGKYEFRLWANERYIGRATFSAAKAGKQ